MKLFEKDFEKTVIKLQVTSQRNCNDYIIEKRPLRKKIVEKFLEHKTFFKIFLKLVLKFLRLSPITFKFLLSSFQFNTRM